MFKQTIPFTLKVNTPPPTIEKCVIAQTKTASAAEPAYYVLCLQLPAAEMNRELNGSLVHKDIAGITINETSYSLSIDSAQRQLNVKAGSPFIGKDSVEKLAAADAEEIPSGWTLYFKTDVAVGDAKKAYTISVKDEKGLYSKPVTAATQLSEPQPAQAAIITGTKIDSLSMDGTAQDKAIVIKADDAAPEAQIQLSVPATGVISVTDVTIHYTLTEVGQTPAPEQTRTSPITVDMPLNGAGEKMYALTYFTDGVGFKPSASKTVYYKVVKEHTVTFDSKGGSAVPAQKILHGSKILPIPSVPTAPSGYTFRNWCIDEACTTAWDFASGTVTADITLYAKWDPAGGVSYTVQHFQQNIDDDNYPTAPSATQTLNGTTGQLTTATANGYAGFEPLPIEQKTIAGDGTTVVEVKYKRKRITLTFKLAGGNVSSSTDDVTHKGKFDATFTVPVPTRDGYTFTGWNFALPSSPVFPAADTTYTAQWTAHRYKVQFNGNGSTAGSMSEQEFTYDIPQALQPNGFENTGYTFRGWANAYNATEPVYTDTQSVTNLSSSNNAVVQLFAVWQINTYTVTFNVDGKNGTLSATPQGGFENSTGTITVEHGKSVTFTATPTEGWEVDSWTGVTPDTSSPDKTKATLSNVTNTTTVTVKFKKKQAIKVSDWEALRTAVKNASDGDVIEVTGNITYGFTGTESTITVKRNITIKSSTEGSKYILNANGKGAGSGQSNERSTGIFEVENGKTLTLENVKLTRTEKYAVYVAENGSLIMKDVTITDCKTQYNAAGIYFNKGKKLMLTGCTIEKCKGKGGNSSGGIDIQEPKESVTITGTTIQDCEAQDNGGGINLKNDNNAQCALQNVTVQRCIATNGGGGGVCVKAGALTITGGSFTENLAIKGGGIFVDKGTSAQAGTVTISGTQDNPVVIAKNEADHGGGLYNGGTANISYAKFEENTAKHNGGGMYNAGTCTMDGVELKKNKADASDTSLRLGGGIFISADAECTLGKDVKITENSATGTNSNGGGIFVNKDSDTQLGTLTISGTQDNPVVIAKNEAAYGGGLYSYGTVTISYAEIKENKVPHNGGGMYNKGTCRMQHVTVKDNTASDPYSGGAGRGGGIYNEKTLTLTNTTVTGNTATLSGGALHLESNDSAFTMSGSTVITVDPSKNDVFLQERRFITIESALTVTENVARITPENYTVGVKVLQPSTEYAKFTVTPKDGNTWSIKSDGTLQQP